MGSMAGGALRFKRILEQSTALSVFDVQWIHHAAAAARHRGRRCYWTPVVTITTFLRQILFGNCSCREAVALTVSSDVAGEAKFEDVDFREISGDPSAYSQARSRLPLAMFTHLHRRISDASRERVGALLPWCNRRVIVTDGSTIVMPDEPALQAAFPQPGSQKPGCGFPMARLTALFCWASGTLLELAIDSIHVHELTLLRRMFKQFRAGDVLLGDRIFCSYVDIVLLQEQKVDSVTRMHVSRCNDMRKGIRLGANDRLVEWQRPHKRPAHLTQEQWKTIPATMTIRHVRYDVNTPGFRTQRIELATTLLDPLRYPVEELAQLYRGRWRAELNLRNLKSTLGMDQLHTRSVDMIRKEVAMYVIAYNMIRMLMWQAAIKYKTDPQRLTFAGTVQRLTAMMPYMAICRSEQQRQMMHIKLLTYLAHDVLPSRPNRYEPRRIKRRHNQYLPLFKTRNEHKNYLMKQSA